MTDIQIKCFLTLAETLNFTKAAEKLCLCQSTFSKHISSLEKNLNLRLFIRTKKTVALSPEGRIMYKAFKAAVEKIEKGVSDANNLHQSHANLIRIGYMQSFNTSLFLNNIINAYKQLHPEIIINLLSMNNSSLIEGLDKQTLDIVFTLERVHKFRPDLESGSVYETPVSVISSRFNGNEERKELNWSDLNRETFLVVSRNADPTEKEFLKNILEPHNVVPLAIIEVSSVEAQLINVELGMGVAFSDHISRAYGNDKFLFVDIPDLSTSCVWLCKHNLKNPVVKAFKEYLRSHNDA